MSKNYVILAGVVLFLAGCASVEGPTLVNGKVVSPSDEINQLREENKALNDKISALESPSNVKMPTGAQVQTALKNAGFYKGQIDGQIGPKTKEALKKFQEVNGLNPDGVIGSRTWEKLAGYLNK